MFNYQGVKEKIIIILFSLSLILSFVVFPNLTNDNRLTFIVFNNFDLKGLEFRFLYLLTILFLIYDSIYLKKIDKNLIIFSVLIPTLIIIYSIFIFVFKFNNDYNFFDLIKEQKTLKFIFKLTAQSIVIGLSILIISYYKNFIIDNLSKIIDFSVFIFITLIILLEIFYSGILFDTLFKCDLGFFYNTKFLFKESSHFAIISAPILTFFIYNIRKYYKNFFLFTIYIFFLIFCFGTFNLTFFLAIVSSIIIVFITCKNIENISKLFFLILIIISNIFFFIDKSKIPIYDNCVSKQSIINKKYSLLDFDKAGGYFVGKVESERKKLLSLLKKDRTNLSTSIYLYSLYVAKSSISENLFGAGINNYKNYRYKIDNSLKKEWVLQKGIYKEKIQIIKFKEKYMPNIRAYILPFNYNSGSIMFSKLVTEIGIIYILILTLIFVFSFSNKIDNNIKVFFIPLIFIQTFIRGTGYFNSGFLISLIVVLTIILSLQIKKNENKKSSNL